jgi:hypothetical protein
MIETDGDTLLRVLNGDINPMEVWSGVSMRASKSLDALAKTVPACIGSVYL